MPGIRRFAEYVCDRGRKEFSHLYPSAPDPLPFRSAISTDVEGTRFHQASSTRVFEEAPVLHLPHPAHPLRAAGSQFFLCCFRKLMADPCPHNRESRFRHFAHSPQPFNRRLRACSEDLLVVKLVDQRLIFIHGCTAPAHGARCTQNRGSTCTAMARNVIATNHPASEGTLGISIEDRRCE